MTDDFQQKKKALARCLAELHREGFEHAEILVSWNEEGHTHHLADGHGNFYARLGMAQEFIQCNDARIHHQVRKDEYPDFS